MKIHRIGDWHIYFNYFTELISLHFVFKPGLHTANTVASKLKSELLPIFHYVRVNGDNVEKW